MRILCDWVDEIKHYNLGETRLSVLRELCQKNGAYFELCQPELLTYADNEVVAYIGNRFDVRLLDNFPNIRWVHFGSIGTDRLPIEAARSSGIKVTNSKGIFEYSVALHAIYLLLNSKYFDLTTYNFTRRDWEQSNPQKLFGQNIFVLGTGLIAQLIYSLLERMGLNVKVVGREGSQLQKSEQFDFRLHSNLQDFCCEHSILINALPLTQSTKGMINGEYLDKFDFIACYVNVGRKETEDLGDIIDRLRRGRVGYAAWDVIRDNCIARSLSSEFSEKVLFTPHIAAFHVDHWPHSMQLVEENLIKFFSDNMSSMRNSCYV